MLLMNAPGHRCGADLVDRGRFLFPIPGAAGGLSSPVAIGIALVSGAVLAPAGNAATPAAATATTPSPVPSATCGYGALTAALPPEGLSS
ncbi:hypothetical protein [Streptomyces sp. NPDC059466]|uniref:hypothetical protein n=1 Tax=unclassified Streptomyces TaxID=2593676 RepID=UPI0036A5E29A